MDFFSKSILFFVAVALFSMTVDTTAEETKPDLSASFQKAMSDLNTTLSGLFDKLNDETKKNLQTAVKQIGDTVNKIRAKGQELYDGQKTETKKA